MVRDGASQVICEMLVPVIRSETLQVPAESDEEFLLIYGAPAPHHHPHPRSHPRLLELDHEGAAGVRYCFAIKLNRPKVFRDNASLYQSIHERGKICWFGAVPTLFSWLHTLKTVVCVFLFSLFLFKMTRLQ